MSNKSPAIDIAKNQQNSPDEFIRLSTGVIVKLIPVPSTARS